MKRASYREHDYSFGQAMLTLRTTIGLTQSGLAEYLRVSRQAIGDWEAGHSYPKFEHLKKLITLAVQCQAFTIGHEAEEIKAFWNAAHQKVRLDEAWLAELVSPEYPQSAGKSDQNSDYIEQARNIKSLERNYRRLVESISEGISVLTLEGIITSLSPALETLLGWSSEQLSGTHLRSVIHPADLPKVLDRFQRDRNGEFQPPMKIRLLQSSGAYVSVEVSSQPEIENGKVSNIWVLIKDLTKDEQMQNQRVALTQEKQHVQVLTDLILASTAKVRPSLESVSLITNALSRQSTDRASLEVIEQLVQHLTVATDRILTMAELDADRTQFSFGPVDLNQLMGYMQINERSLAEMRKVTLIPRLSQGSLLVKADQTYLYRAIQEVVENALKYSSADGTVILETAADDACGFVMVQDNGSGIDSKLMPHLFEKFYHFGFPSSASGELGLGLSITKKIIEKHKGTVRVESGPNQGTTLTISIPLYMH